MGTRHEIEKLKSTDASRAGLQRVGPTGTYPEPVMITIVIVVIVTIVIVVAIIIIISMIT